MKSILIFILLLLTGCNNTTTHKKTEIHKEIIIYQNQGLIFRKKNDKIFFDINKTKILLFSDNTNLSKQQIITLKKAKIKFYDINNSEIKDYFKIIKYPTLIILNKHKIKKYEGFIPIEVLKFELKD